MALVSPSPLPPIRYGGSERASMWLRKGLLELAHEVVLLCPKNTAQQSALPSYAWPQSPHEWRELVRNQKIDLLHFMCLAPESFPKDEIPHLVTVHGNGKPNEKFFENSVFVSANHAHRHGAEAFVYNGLDLDEYPLLKKQYSSHKRALFLAKASWPVKNLKGSLRITKKAAWSLDVAGGSRPLSLWGLFAFHARFHGMVDDAQKLRIMQSCDALLFPVFWHEPFGIAVIEALACGLPALTSGYGSLPEIVNASCGLVAQSEDEIVEFLQDRIQSISPAVCRSRVAEAFTHRHMSQKYLEYYLKVLANEPINSKQPQTLPNNDVFRLDPKNIASRHP